jgi:predicted metal-dependent hydrolase
MTGRAGPSRLPAAADAEPLVEVRRSARRRRTVSAYRDGDRTVVLIPARMSRAEERRWVAAMLERLDRQDRKLRPGDEALLERAVALSRRYLEGAPVPASVRWVGNQGSRWGSCTPVDRTIRLSDRLQGMPGWVLDYVLVHELVHLRVPGHGADFWAEVEQFPRTERARGYLEGVSATAGLGFSDADENDADESIADEGDAPTIDENVEIIAPTADVGRGKRRAATRRGPGTRPSNSRQRSEQCALDFDMFDSDDICDRDEVDAGDRA